MKTIAMAVLLAVSLPAFAEAPKVKLQMVLRGLDRPVQFLTHPDGRSMVVEQVGRGRFF